MVKGVSRQVIVLQSPDREHFEQAIFILREGQIPVSDDVLLREASKIFAKRSGETKQSFWHRAGWVACGGGIVSALWFLSALL